VRHSVTNGGPSLSLPLSLIPRDHHSAVVQLVLVNSGSRITAPPSGHILPVFHLQETIALPGEELDCLVSLLVNLHL